MRPHNLRAAEGLTQLDSYNTASPKGPCRKAGGTIGTLKLYNVTRSVPTTRLWTAKTSG